MIEYYRNEIFITASQDGNLVLYKSENNNKVIEVSKLPLKIFTIKNERIKSQYSNWTHEVENSFILITCS